MHETDRPDQTDRSYASFPTKSDAPKAGASEELNL